MIGEGIAACGTVRGFLAHLHRGTPACGLCRVAWEMFSTNTSERRGRHVDTERRSARASVKQCRDCKTVLPLHMFSDNQLRRHLSRCPQCAIKAYRRNHVPELVAS